MDTALSPFLYIVDDSFSDYWTNAWYPFADSFF